MLKRSEITKSSIGNDGTHEFQRKFETSDEIDRDIFLAHFAVIFFELDGHQVIFINGPQYADRTSARLSNGDTGGEIFETQFRGSLGYRPSQSIMSFRSVRICHFYMKGEFKF